MTIVIVYGIICLYIKALPYLIERGVVCLDVKDRENNGELIEISRVGLEGLIYTIRGQQVMIDSDLAKLYQVETRVLNQAVKKNIERFPDEFMFKLSDVIRSKQGLYNVFEEK